MTMHKRSPFSRFLSRVLGSIADAPKAWARYFDEPIVDPVEFGFFSTIV